jgi:hypothetical protein
MSSKAYNPEASLPFDDTEPADPENINHALRSSIQIAPTSEVENLPKVFVACGCGNCPDLVDPLYDVGGDIRNDFWAIEECDSPQPITIGQARQVYIAYQRSAAQSSDREPKYKHHQYQTYPRIIAGDRHFRKQFDGLTTVLLTRRLRPKNEDGDWISPYQLDATLHDNHLMKRTREILDYQLRRKAGLEFEYCRVTAPTKTAATPHEHRYLWIDDPNNEVCIEHIRPALEEHLEYPGAYREDHPFDSEGHDGAITIRHTPPVVDETEAREYVILHTLAAQYLASQLSHLPLRDKFDPKEDDPQPTLLEGGAIDWATPSRWFGASNGVPTLDGR